MSRQGAESLLSQPVPRALQSCSSAAQLTRFASLAQPLGDGERRGTIAVGTRMQQNLLAAGTALVSVPDSAPSIAKSLPISNAGGRISNLEADLEQEQRRHSRLMA